MTNNTFVQNLANASNYTRTANGAWAHSSSMNSLLDLFSLGGAYRQRSDEDVIFLFKKAFDEDETYAMKCLFYLRDVRGGAGERRFFRVCMRWLANNHLDAVIRNLDNIPEFGRYDDWFILLDTPAKTEVLKRIKEQLAEDVQTEYPTLLAKWLPSLNASSAETHQRANIIRKYLNWSNKQYRKTLSILRERLNVLERLMSAKQWDRIDFAHIPSKAGLQYRKAFERHDIERKQANPEAVTYEEFANDASATVRADALYPYDILSKTHANSWWVEVCPNFSETERAMINKYWENQRDWLNGEECKMICVCDTSSSMLEGGTNNATPMNIAVSLSMYCAERLSGPFKDYFISFSRNARLVKVEGIDFVDKAQRIIKSNVCENTNLASVFDLLLEAFKHSNPEDWVSVVTIISDMQIDENYSYSYRHDGNRNQKVVTEMEAIRAKWAVAGIPMPRLVYWNVNASKDTQLDLAPDVQLVSGCSPSLFKQILQSKDRITLMMDILNSERYAAVK